MRLRRLAFVVQLVALATRVVAAAPSPLRMSFSDAHGLAPTSGAELVRQEVDRLLSEARVPVSWSDRIAAADGAAARDVTIVLTPSVPGGAGWPVDPSALGVYLISGESSAVFVFSPRVRAALGLPAPGQRMLRPRERRDLARAVARVAVHELVHRFAPSLPHAESGVMQSRLDRGALTAARLVLDERSRLALSRAVEGDVDSPKRAPRP